MDPTLNLFTASSLFVGSHFILSHPLRAPLVTRVGATGFQLIYSSIAIATMILMINAYRAMPAAAPLWTVGEGGYHGAAPLMLIAAILLVGSFTGNPALPMPPELAAKAAAADPRGVFAITRHPMMWSFAIWAAVHAALGASVANLILCGAIALLALGGAAAQDHKKRTLMGPAWTSWTQRTSFVPFAALTSGRIDWKNAWPGWAALIGGGALWLIATWAHPYFGMPMVGIWR